MNTVPDRAASRGASALLFLAACAFASGGCGAKTGLRVPDLDAAPVPDAMDAPDVLDALDTPDVIDETPLDLDARTYLGTEFWAVSTSNSLLAVGDTFHFAVAIGNPGSEPVTATIEGGALSTPRVVTIPPHDTVTTQLPWVRDLAQNSGEYANCDDRPRARPAHSALVRMGAYHIITTAPVSAYQFNPLEFGETTSHCSLHSYTNDASLLLPTPTLTGNYLVLAHNAFTTGSFVAIAATAPGTTTVRVSLHANIVAGPGVEATQSGETLTYALEQGDVVQLLSEDGSLSGRDEYSVHDMTGSVVRADAPVAVFAGVDCTDISWPNGSSLACDHVEEQLFPEEVWGRDAVVSQFRDRGDAEGSVVRVISRDDGNEVTFSPASVHAPVHLDRGQIVEFEARQDFALDARTPVLVAQFMEGQETTPGADMGDPAMVLEVPTSQFRRNYAIVVPATYTANFLNLVTRAGTVILLDGQALQGATLALEGTPWQVVRATIAPGSHMISSEDESAFGIKVLGVAPYTSYVYPGGLDLERSR